MERARSQNGTLRIIAKFVLLGLLVVLLAKAILILVTLAGVGLLIYICARTFHFHRDSVWRIAVWTKEILGCSVAAIFRLIPAILATSVWLLLCALWVCWALGGLVSAVTRISLWVACGSLRQCTKVLASSLVAALLYGRKTIATRGRAAFRGAGNITRVALAAGVRIGKLSGPIYGSVVEVASGALVGAILLSLRSVEGLLFLPEIDDAGARACAAVLFGAFLGITLGLSRATWTRESEATVDPN
jgi:hypothetical protein